jgi:hypothetical protein
LKTKLDGNKPILCYVRLNIERWIGKVDANDNVTSIEICMETPKPERYTFDLSLVYIPKLIIINSPK